VEFNYSRQNLSRKEQRLERAFGIVPGALSWLILLSMITLSVSYPLVAAVLIIAFEIYWILRLVYMTIFLWLSFFRLSLDEDTDWMKWIGEIDRLKHKTPPMPSGGENWSFKQKIADYIHRKQIHALKTSNQEIPGSENIYHLVIIPVAKEAYGIIKPSIDGILRGSYPAQRIVVCIAIEEWADELVKKGVLRIQDEFRETFMDFHVIVHPSGLPGEARVKGANTTYAAKSATQYFRDRGIPHENIIVSCFDADTVPGSDYFACLTYYFLVTSCRHQASFQPIPVYNNNIWEASSFARVLDIGSSFVQMIEATDPEKQITFSSHSMSFKTLIELGYWSRNIISDDSSIYWKAFLHFDGHYEVVPMYVTLSMDVTQADSVMKTFVNVYKQKRRWAWGVENFPIVMRGFLSARNIPLKKKMKHGFKLLERHINWATWPFLLSIVSWLPALFGDREFFSTTVYYSAPQVRSVIFQLASVSLISCILTSLLLLPKKKVKHHTLRKIRHAFEWLLVPVVSMALGAIPALDAQTRLMFGRYMDFWVTDKFRKM